MSVTILQYKRLAALTDKKTLIYIKVTLEQAVAELKTFYLQINNSDHILNFNYK